ncbi:MAG: MmgE/PrpD family protein, partial [Gaiellales bacterium]
GWASLGGVPASGLALRGGTGPATVLDGRFGLLPTHLDEEQYDLSALTADLGEVWETMAVAIKPYPACHCTHTVLDALRLIIEATGIGADDVETIVCRVPSEVAVRLVLEPSERKQTPSNPYDAKFSLPFTVGNMLVHDRVGVESFTSEAIADPNVLAVAARVDYEVRPFDQGNADLAGAITVRTRDGRELYEEVLVPRGGSANPMNADEIREKFRLNASLALPDADVDALIDAFEGLETDGAGPIGALLARARG